MLVRARFEAKPIEIVCADGVRLGGHCWSAPQSHREGTVIVNPATGVPARYYHAYAEFLSEHGFDVLTWDYRGIGLSRPPQLRGCTYRWRDWGELDFDSVVRFALARDPHGPLVVVGHSIGGFLPGLARSAPAVSRMLTIGAQFGYCGDYAHRQRRRLFLKWHVAMPAITAVLGFFPGKRLGWLEDLPAGVALEWALRRSALELSWPASERADLLGRLAAVAAPILAVTTSDDPLATPAAIRRALGYYRGAPPIAVLLAPADLGVASLGHFGLFSGTHASGFWVDTLLWLREGTNPWPDKPLPLEPDSVGARARSDATRRREIVRYY